MREKSAGPTARVWLVAGLAVTVIGIMLVSWWPRPVDAAVLELIERVVPGIRNAVINSPGYGLAEIIANVLMYVPLGVVVGLLARGSASNRSAAAEAVGVAIAVAVVLSVVAESGQALWLPQRYPTGWDVLANATGAMLGVAGVIAVRRSAQRSAPR